MRLLLRASVLALLVALAAGVWSYREWRPAPLPDGLAGTLVFVSDRDGADTLYLRRLPDGRELRLTAQSEPTREPALSPDGRSIAFSMGGRIGLVGTASGDVRFLTLGVDWRDSAPAWHPAGRGLVVCSRAAPGEHADLHLLGFDPSDASPGDLARRPLTLTPRTDESSPVFGPDGGFVVFAREDDLFRLELADGRTRRLTGGFRKVRAPRFLPSGRLVFLWTQGKEYGIDVMDSDGGDRETLSRGSVSYRSLVPSPDGRYLAATFTFDLAFHPSDALRPRRVEEVHLLDAQGRPAGALVRSWRHSNHSPDWGR